jgi:hypothetical protein
MAEQKALRPLLAAGEAYLTSLPRCLRHGNKEEALTDAISISKSLNILFMSLADEEWADGKAAGKGLDLFTALLLDKLEIAADVYKFPLGTWKDVPALAERKGE